MEGPTTVITKKVKATREDVLQAFAPGTGKAEKWGVLRPLGTNEIARFIADERGGDWYEPYALLSRDALVQLLEEMTIDFTLVMDLGSGWRSAGITWHDQRAGQRYWTTRERAEEWTRERTAEREAREAEQREKEADRYAREHLVIRHRDEYEGLMEAYRNGARLVEDADR
jgi:hypothetical protein